MIRWCRVSLSEDSEKAPALEASCGFEDGLARCHDLRISMFLSHGRRHMR